MPLYEYRCKACEQVFEYMLSMSARAKRKCEDCGGRLEKLVSRSGFVLKGTGWYETDFKDGGSAKSNDSSDSSKGDADKPAASSDEKPGKSGDKSTSKAPATKTKGKKKS
jgi:putative FmdB family regulatory protein